MAKIYVGCAGWEYSGWIGPFYPKILKRENHLRYYSDFFTFTEINSTFYNLPKPKTVKHWLNQVPKNFQFAVKVWRKITHEKPEDLESVIGTFFKRLKILESKIFGYLLQFPPKFKYNNKNLDHLTRIIDNLPSNSNCFLEFRELSWFNLDILEPILYPANMTLVTSYIEGINPYYFPGQSQYYIRMIGDHELEAFNSIQREQKEALEDLERNLRTLVKSQQVKKVIVIFNNNFRGFAPDDANDLIKKFDIPQHFISKQRKLLDFV